MRCDLLGAQDPSDTYLVLTYNTTSKVFANGLFTTKTHYYQCYRTQNSRQSKILKIQNVLEFYFNKTFINSEFID